MYVMAEFPPLVSSCSVSHRVRAAHPSSGSSDLCRIEDTEGLDAARFTEARSSAEEKRCEDGYLAVGPLNRNFYWLTTRSKRKQEE